MTSAVSQDLAGAEERSPSVKVRQRANDLAERLEQGGRALAAFAGALSHTPRRMPMKGSRS
jgi:hypothetical protein